MAFKFNDKTQQFVSRNSAQLDSILNHMAQEIMIIGNGRAPRKSGDLAASGRVEKKGDKKYKIVFGGGRIAYAGYQERGRRMDGSRAVRNYTTAGTGKDFLKNAGKIVVAKTIYYLRQGLTRVK